MSSTQCPHCQVHLKLPEEKLHSKVKCPKCGVAFQARPAAAGGHAPTQRQRKKPTKKKISATPFIVLLVAGGITIAVWMMIQGGEGGEGQTAGNPSEQPASTAPASSGAPAQVDPFEHPATRPAKQMQAAVLSYNDRQMRGLLDLKAWFEREQPGGRLWSSLRDSERSDFGKQLAERLFQDPELRRYADLTLSSASFASMPSDTAELTLRSADEPKMLWKFSTALMEGSWKIRSYSFEEEAELQAAEDAASKTEPGGDKHFVETQGGGRQLRGVIQEVELVSGTTAEEEKTIRGLLTLALAESGLESRLAKKDLVKTGHKAVPILLNEMVARPLNGTQERTEEVAILHGFLQDISFRQISFPLRDLEADRPEVLEQRRQQAVEAWFGWWKIWGSRWEAWAEKSGMPLPEPPKAGRTRR